MLLNLNEIEARALETALSNHLIGLRDERAHTDDRAFRHDLSTTIDQLEAIHRRLVDIARATA